MSQKLGSGEIFQVFVIHDHIYQNTTSFEVMMPDLESFMHSEKFLIMDIIVEFGGIESARVKSDWVNFSVGVRDG